MYYPINLDLDRRPALVVGGGRVAERKALALVEFGAKVTVISPTFTQGLLGSSRSRRLKIVRRAFRQSDLKGKFVTVCATSDHVLNGRVARWAKLHGQLVNVVDIPRLSNFIFPSVFRRGHLVISISTDGTVPALSKKIRKELEVHFGSRYGKIVQTLARIRKGIRDEVTDIRARQILMNDIVNRDFHMLADRPKRARLERKVKGLIKKLKGT